MISMPSPGDVIDESTFINVTESHLKTLDEIIAKPDSYTAIIVNEFSFI